MNRKVFGFLSILVLGAAAGCGNGTDPLTTLGDSSTPLANALSLPVAAATGFSAYGNGSDGFGFTTGIGASVKAAANGLVISVDNGGQAVTVMHNTRILTRYRNVTSANVQVGNYVTSGAQIGTVNTIGTVYFSVLADGTAVCPLSYLSSSARATLPTMINGSTNPCLQ